MRKRRPFSAECKAEQVLSGVKSQAEVCREYQLNPQVFNRWKSQLLEHAHQLFQRDEHRSAEQLRIAELEQALGRKTMELAPWGSPAKTETSNTRPHGRSSRHRTAHT
jgi:transposase